MLKRKLAAEALGTALLLIGVVGSGIMAERLSPTDAGLQLFQNAAATAGVLLVIIVMFGPLSGAHFNPVVTLADWALGGFPRRHVAAYISAQITGAVIGTVLANLMFDLDAVNWSTKTRSAGHLWLGEVIATVGLVAVIFALVRTGRLQLVAGSVAAYIGAAYYFSSSTSFANPAVTLGRMFSDTFAGIEPSSAPMFILMQLIGLVLATGLIRFIYPDTRPDPV
ncbi:MAG: aquaporin family protein [Acidimicrobiaceae bacterium]|nr:aquaporin family protein [Acidimicrobiia bacterium]MCY4494078.1 aquaporin family protein [Acidimicrobiaceae bacterium]